MFDPEKVERLYHTTSGDMDVDANYNPNTPAYRYVKASNYDKLLALYHEMVAEREDATLERKSNDR